MTVKKSTNITWHKGAVTKKNREKLLNHKGIVIWFTGLSASGKSTLAHALEERLFQEGKLSFVLDGDNVRHGLNKNLGFSPEDREENIRRIGEVAKLFSEAGIITMTAFISPYIKDRAQARKLLKKGEFIEVFLKVPLEVAEKRDPKGLYKKAKAGEIQEFTGISAPYEEPKNPEIIIDTSKTGIKESTEIIYQHLKEKGVFFK